MFTDIADKPIAAVWCYHQRHLLIDKNFLTTDIADKPSPPSGVITNGIYYLIRIFFAHRFRI